MLAVVLQSLARHAFTVGAGWLVARGIVTDEQASGAVKEAVDVAVPVLMTVAPFGVTVPSDAHVGTAPV